MRAAQRSSYCRQQTSVVGIEQILVYPNVAIVVWGSRANSAHAVIAVSPCYCYLDQYNDGMHEKKMNTYTTGRE